MNSSHIEVMAPRKGARKKFSIQLKFSKNHPFMGKDTLSQLRI